MRQCIFSFHACVVAIGVYFLLKPYLGKEIVSWLWVLVLVPFAALDFVKYNKITAEKTVCAWFKSEFLIQKKLVFRNINIYYKMMKPYIDKKNKVELKLND